MAISTLSWCKQHQKTILNKGQYTIELSDSIMQLAPTWSQVVPDDLFFSIDFLHCVEVSPPSGIVPYYGVVFSESRPVGIIYLQLKDLKLKENLRLSSTTKSLSSRISTNVKQVVINQINFHSIICGNLLLTGKYGFHFKENIPLATQFDLVEAVTEDLKTKLKLENIHPGLTLLKDFFDKDVPSFSDNFTFTKFKVQPKMILDVAPNWKTFDDYLEDMKSKYRVRARKAMKMAQGITRKIFDADDIAAHEQDILALYRHIADDAGFNAFILDDKYFENLKRALGKHLTFTTYWLNDRMVAFFTSIKNYDILDAHFLGYDPQCNVKCQLYLNMLYDLIREGIDQRVAKIDLSRTAVEIKSTVGAEPKDMYLFLKHNNKILNKAVAPILNLVKPAENFIIRSPFRDDTAE